MNSFSSFVIKEAKHILRDRRTMLILFAMPAVMMLLFGFAISTDVRNVRTVVVTSAMNEYTQKVVDKLAASSYFDVTDKVSTTAEAERLLRRQQADMALVFTSDFSLPPPRLDGRIQMITDGADPGMAQRYADHAMQIVSAAVSGSKQAAPVSVRLLYNPQMKSSYLFVPGIMGMLLLLICAMMTSVSIVGEKERGTMEVLLVSPVRPLMVVVAKAIPYLLLALGILTVILLMSYYVLGVPLAGSLFWIVAVSMLYILLALSLGLLISTMASTRLTAILLSAMVLLMPCLMLSGMIFPIESMPPLLRWLTVIVPPRYYISAMRKLMVMGTGIGSAMQEVAVLGVMTVALLSMAIAKFDNRLSR